MLSKQADLMFASRSRKVSVLAISGMRKPHIWAVLGFMALSGCYGPGYYGGGPGYYGGGFGGYYHGFGGHRFGGAGVGHAGFGGHGFGGHGFGGGGRGSGGGGRR